MRIIECAFNDGPRLGESKRPAEDAVRLAQHATLSFCGMPVKSFDRGGPAPRLGTLRVHYPGLFGPNGPLPLHLTEYVVDRIKHRGDRALRDFLDIFQHRLLSIYWRAIASARPTVQIDRPDRDRFANYYACVGGFARIDDADVDPRVGRARRHWAGHFARQVRSAEGLESVLSGFFGASVRVEEFVGTWLDLPTAGSALGDGCSLGSDTFLGESFWDCSQSVRIVLGELNRDQYERLLPSGENWRLLEQLVSSYLGVELSWDVCFSLRAGEVGGLPLDGTRRLGWTTWLQDGDSETRTEDLILRHGRRFHDSTRDEHRP